jgi:hypothetical protein
MHLASHGHTICAHEYVGEHGREASLESPIEVEFASQSAPDSQHVREPGGAARRLSFGSLSWPAAAESEGINEERGNFPFPAQTDDLFDQLTSIFDVPLAECHRASAGYEILSIESVNFQGRFKKYVHKERRTDKAVILWLSATEFVSLHRISIESFRCEMTARSYSYAMSVQRFGCNFPWRLMAYSMPQLDGVAQFRATSDLPLRFVRHALAPIVDEVSSFEIEIVATTPIESALALVPSIEQTPMDNTTIFVKFPSTELLHALASYPVHQRVRLRIEAGHGLDPVTPQVLNDLLRGFRLPVHLQVPSALLDLDCVDEPFTTNPSIDSLTISTWNRRLSTKMLNGIARNKGMTRLFIDCSDWDDFESDYSIHSVIKAVFHHALRGSRNLKCLTLVSRFDDSRYHSPKQMQESFERLGQDLDLASYNLHSVSKFHWSFPNSRIKLRLESSSLWDSGFTPALVLNCLSRQPGGSPPANLLGLAVRRINQGMLYKYATDLAPWDLSTSSASALFHLTMIGYRNPARVEESDGR